MFKVLNHSDHKIHSTQTPPSSIHSLYDGWWLGHEQQTLHRVGILSISHVLGHTPSMRKTKRRKIGAWKVLQLIEQSTIIHTLNLHLCQAKKLVRLWISGDLHIPLYAYFFWGRNCILFNAHHLSVTNVSRSQTEHIMGTRLILIYRPHKRRDLW